MWDGKGRVRRGRARKERAEGKERGGRAGAREKC